MALNSLTLKWENYEIYEIKPTFSSVTCPQTNESIERFHFTFCEMISSNQEHYEEHPQCPTTIIQEAKYLYLPLTNSFSVINFPDSLKLHTTRKP